MVTIKDVAAKAGVSTATVSNYLNHTKPVRKETEKRIKQAIDELQYHQNISARSLKASEYTDIGIILPNLNDPYYVQIFQGIESAFQNTPYFLNLALSYDIPEIERNAINNMLRKRICGLILVTCCPHDWKFYYENFNRYDRPIVLLDRAIPNLDCNFVTFEYRETMKALTHTILNKKYNNIVLLAGPEQYTCEKECAEGFLEAFREAGIEPSSYAVNHIENNKEDSFRKVVSLLRHTIPDAVFTTSSLSEEGTVEALYVLGYTVEDIRLLSLGQEHWNKYTRTRSNFCTARPAIKMGTTAANILMGQIRAPLLTESQRVVLPSNMDPGCPLQYKYFIQGNDQLHFNLNDDIVQMDRVMPRKEDTFYSKKPPANPIVLRVLMMEMPYVRAVCDFIRNFEVLTGIQVEVDLLPHNALYDEIHDAVNREVYDVCMYDTPWMAQFAVQGVLADITEHVSHIANDVFLPDSLESFYDSRGRCYGLPFIQAPQILYYRKDLFDDINIQAGFEKLYGSRLRPPLTFAEFNAVAEYFTFHTDAIEYGCSVPAENPGCLSSAIYTRLLSSCGQIIDKEGNIFFDRPETLRAYVNFMRTLAVAAPDYKQTTDADAAEDFLSGKTAMLISYPTLMTDMTDLRRNSMAGSIGYSYIPNRYSLLGGWGLGVTSSSRHVSEAADFVKWCCCEQMSGYFALTGSLGTVSNTYCNDELVKLFPWLPLYQSASDYMGSIFPSVINGHSVISTRKISEIISHWGYRMIDKECTVEEAIQNTQKDLENYISKELPLVP